MAISGALVALVASVVESYMLVALASDRLPVASLPMALLVTLTFNFFLLACYNFLIYPSFVSPLRHLPSPKGALPLIGQAQTMFETPPGESHTKWMNTVKNEGLIRFQGLWNSDMVLVSSPAALAEILVSKTYQFEKPANGREHLRPVLGDGLVVVEGDEHKFQRKRVMPSFGFRHIKDLYPVMWSKAETLCQRLDADFTNNDSITVDIVEWASRATLDAIGVAALGRDFNSIYNDEDQLAYLYRQITEPTPARQLYFAISLLFGPKNIRALPLPINRALEQVSVMLRDICRKLVQEKREAIAQRGDDHYDILSVLVKSNDFSDTELIDQMLTFLAAGSDTTSLTFTWTCHLLTKYPKVQQKLREELMPVREQLLAAAAVSRDNDSDASLASILESLPYLNGVFHETLRLFPTVAMTLRTNPNPTTVLGHPIPAGTHFLLSIQAMNRSPEFWGPDATEFKPERWIDAETGKPNNHGGAVNNYCFLTFLAGPRSCIGQNFARAELRCLLAAWLLHYDMEDANPSEPIPIGAVTTKPMGGMWIKLRQLQQKA